MVVEKSIRSLDGSQVALTITVDAAAIEEAYQNKMKKYQANIQLDGFRKGKAPIAVIERKYGDAIREESTFEALEENLKQVIETLDEKDRPLAYSTPVLQDEEKLVPFKKDENVTFTVHYDVYPQFKVESYKGREVKYDGAEVKESDVNEELDRIRDQNAVVRTKDGTIAMGDIVTLDYVELDENKAEKADTKREGFTFTLGTGYNYYRIDEDLVGLAKGDEKIIEKKYDDNDVTFKGASITLKVKVDEIKYREIPELSDELAQDVKDDYKTVDDLVKGTREKLEKELEESMKNDKINALLDAIKAKTEITIPASMLAAELENAWRNFYHQSGLTEEQILSFLKMQGSTKEALLDEWKDSCTSNLKDQLILDAIKDKEDFAVSDEEFKEEWEKNYKSVKDEDKEYYENILRDSLKFAKVTPFLLENNTFKAGKKVSYDDFIAGAYKEEE